METHERRHIIYSGRVQGVGFRAAAQRLAMGFPIAGYVKNLPNGSVQLVVEGSAESLEAYVSQLAMRLTEYIDQAESRSEPPEGLTGFCIRY